LLQADAARARPLYEESLGIRRAFDNLFGIQMSLANPGSVAFLESDLAGAWSRFAEAVDVAQRLADPRVTAAALLGVGGVLASQGVHSGGEDRVRAAQVLGAGAAVLSAAGAVLEPEDLMPYEQAVAVTRAALGEELFTT
jgi:hypothetical protein